MPLQKSHQTSSLPLTEEMLATIYKGKKRKKMTKSRLQRITSLLMISDFSLIYIINYAYIIL